MSKPHDTYTPAPGASDSLLAKPLQYLRGVGPRFVTLLARLNLHTVQDLIYHFPIAHKDRASVTPIMQVVGGREVNIVARIIDVRGKTFNGKEKIEALLEDPTGQLYAGWWNPYVTKRLTPYATAFFTGKVTSYGGRRELSNPEFEIMSDDGEGPQTRGSEPSPAATVPVTYGRIVPIYNLRPKQRLATGEEAPEVRISQNFLRKLVWNALEAGAAAELVEQLPPELRRQRGLMPISEAIRQFHFPDTMNNAEIARRRLVFEELFVVSLGVALRRAEIEKLGQARRMPLVPAIQKRIEARLPFTLTATQSECLSEIARDMASTVPMNRLLQGDVGSGKTAVAVAAMLLCVAHGGQAAMLAPTEVLAEQHSRTLNRMLAESKVKIGLLRGAMPAAARRELIAQLASGEIHIAIGTHALLESDVAFKDLGLVVVDEQHKFGVAQRMKLRAKGRAPHVLVMTATPIPRTLTLTLYGDLDVSVIGEPPPGRGEVETKWIKEENREKVYRLLIAEARKGHAAYIVLPRIEGDADGDREPGAGSREPNGEGSRMSRAMSAPGSRPTAPENLFSGQTPPRAKNAWNEVKGVEAEVKRLKEHLPTMRIEMLHGRMKSDEKEDVLARLREGKIDALVSTQVIEVGIDLPTATVMMIENAEMFGLSALHQLRGRVGRSERKSYCFVFSAGANEDATERLKTFVKTRNGFEIAEADFSLRGPGQFFGTNQSGLAELKVADLLRDTRILTEARHEAFEIVRRDPALSLPEHAGLKQRVSDVLGKRIGLVDVG